MWFSLMFPTFLFLSFLTVKLVQNPASATDENDSYPPFGDQINGESTELKKIIDPWKYVDQLQMYEIIKTKTNRYFIWFRQNNTGNVFWTLILFYGRLCETDFNYYLSAVPFLAAIDSGIIGILSDNITFLPPRKDQEHCLSLYGKF